MPPSYCSCSTKSCHPSVLTVYCSGILFNAASTALVLYIRSNGSAIYRDGLRLVLILFFLASLSWALVEFLATLIDPSASTTCQVAVVFSSLFDQFGRVFVEQYLVWAVPKGDTKTAFSLIPQILVVGRFFVGIAFTAVTRTQFKPTCAPISSIRAVSITSIALDGVIIGLLLIQAFSSGAARKEPGSHSIALNYKAARLTVVGVALWWGVRYHPSSIVSNICSPYADECHFITGTGECRPVLQNRLARNRSYGLSWLVLPSQSSAQISNIIT